MKNYILILIAALTINTVSATIEENDTKAPLTFSHNLINTPYGKEPQNVEKYFSPQASRTDCFCASFAQYGKTLDFVGVSHDNNPFSLTHTIVNTTFSLFSPNNEDKSKHALIIEGYPDLDGNGLINNQFAPQIREGEEKYGEMALSLHLGLKDQIAVFTGEPKREDMQQKFTDNGFSLDDHFWLEIAAQLEQAVRLQNSPINLSTQNIKDILNQYIEILTQEMPENHVLDSRLSEKALSTWIHEHFDHEITTQEIIDDMQSLDASKYIGRLALFAVKYRDHNLLSRIESVLQTYDHVMVVYGSFHYYALHDALSEKLGSPTYTFA